MSRVGPILMACTRSRPAVTGFLLAAWTAFAGIYVNLGRFAVSDTSCDGGELSASTFGLVYLAVVAAVWMVPFVVLAIKVRSALTIALVVAAALTAAGVTFAVASTPGEFCF